MTTTLNEEQKYALDELYYALNKLSEALESEDTSKVVACQYAVGMAVEDCKLLGLDPALLRKDGTYGEAGE